MDNQKSILASNLRAERNRKGLTQFQLAEIINVSESTISLIERAKLSPSVYIVNDIAKALKIDINELLKGI